MIAALALLVAAAVVVVLVVRSGAKSGSGSKHVGGTTGGAATVARRDLVATDIESGTLSYANPQTVYNRLSGTITWLPHVGAEIRPGGVLYGVDGEPVILMDGSAPAFRTLEPSDVDGIDVLELNRNLKRLGFNAAAIAVDDVWQPATSLGVEELQDSLGEDATGELPLGEVVFLRGPQLVSSLDTSVGSTGSGGGPAASPADSADSSTSVTAAAPEFVGLTSTVTTGTSTQSTTTTTTSPQTTAATTPTTTTTGPSTRATTPTTTTPTSTTGTPPIKTPTSKSGSTDAGSKALSTLAQELKAESAQLKAATLALKAAAKSSSKSSSSSSSKKSKKSNSGGGDSAGSATAIMSTTATRLVVTVDLAASSQSEAKVGRHVGVEMPAGNTVNGRITAVSRVAQSSSSSSSDQSGGQGSGSGGSGSSTVPVTITLARRNAGAGLDQAAVSVSFVSQRARNVQSVPVTALVATSGTQYALQEASPPHTLIPVTVGLFAAGYVQVSGSGVHAGLAVTDSQG